MGIRQGQKKILTIVSCTFFLSSSYFCVPLKKMNIHNVYYYARNTKSLFCTSSFRVPFFSPENKTLCFFFLTRAHDQPSKPFRRTLTLNWLNTNCIENFSTGSQKVPNRCLTYIMQDQVPTLTSEALLEN